MNGLARRLAPRTLRGRLSPVAVTTAALLMTVLTVAFNTVMDRHLQHQADAELRSRRRHHRGHQRLAVLETVNDRLLDANVWVYTGTRLLEKPPSPAAGTLTEAAARLALDGDGVCTTVTAGEPRSVRLCARSVAGHRSTATVVTALDVAPYRNSADAVLLGSLVLDSVMLACTDALTRLAVGRALRPVRTMTDQATEASMVSEQVCRPFVPQRRQSAADPPSTARRRTACSTRFRPWRDTSANRCAP